MARLNLSEGQANYLRALKADADRAQDALATAINAIALAVCDKGGVRYDLGADPFIEVTPPEALPEPETRELVHRDPGIWP